MPDASIPAPVGGWNARDTVEQMPPNDAIQLINFIPGYQGVTGRPGCRKVAETSAMIPDTPVETLAAFEIGSINKLVGATGTSFYEIPTDILIAPTLIKNGAFTSARWQFTHHSQRLIFTNGADVPQVYDGTTMVDIDFTGTDPGVGLTPSDLWGCNTYKGRAWYWEQDAQRVLYADIGSYQGELKEFPLGQMLKFGGTLIAMLTWTNDAGEGIDDMAVFVTSTGETLIYQGDNPSLATEWEMVGRFFLGEPLNIRANANIAGETVLATKDGYVNLSTALRKGRIDETANVSAPIIRAAKDVAERYGSNFGWDCTLFPTGSLFIVNVPISEHFENPPGTVITEYQAEQHAMNTNTGRWCRLEGWNALTFCVFNDQLYFAARDGVHRGMTDTSDNGDPIQFSCITAFNHFDNPAERKQLTSAAIVTNFDYPNFISITGFQDFRLESLPVTGLPPERVPAEWDISDWDEFWWGGGGDPLATRATWQPVIAYGYQLALGIRFQSRGQSVVWYSTKYKFLNGSAV